MSDESANGKPDLPPIIAKRDATGRLGLVFSLAPWGIALGLAVFKPG